MAAPLIADAEITDHQTYEEYKRQVAPLIAKLGADFWCAEANTQSSTEPGSYAPLLALRQPAATDHLVAVQGS